MIRTTAKSIEICDASIGYTDGKSATVLCSSMHATAERGELIALVGPNGSGKSTLIKTLSGLLSILKGVIKINGQNIVQLDRLERSRRMSVVLTEPPFEGLMTVTELVALGRYPYTGWYGKLSSIDWQQVAKSIDLVHLNHKKDAPLSTLSDGERQRALIARMLAQDTEVCVLDEPTSHLDIPNQMDVFSLLRKLTRTHQKTIICSTHQLEIALQLADRIWVFDAEGRFHQGCPENFLADDFLQQIFGNDLIRFDIESLSFKIESDMVGRVYIDTVVHNRHAIEHLVRRNGYKIVSSAADGVITIAYREALWHVSTGVIESTFASLDELNAFMKKTKL